MKRLRDAEREADPAAFAKRRRDETNEYRRAKRALALEPVVRQVERLLAGGKTVGEVAEILESQGVRAGKVHP
jgi:hypothetical protein